MGKMSQGRKGKEMDAFTQTKIMKVDGLCLIRRLCDLAWFTNKGIHIFAIILPINIVICTLLSVTIYELRYNITNLAKHVTITTTDFQIIYKSFFFAWEYKRIVRMKETIDKKFWDLNSCVGKIEQKLTRHFSIIRFLLVLNLVTVIIGTIILIVFPMVPSPANRGPLPVQIWLPESIHLINIPFYELLYSFLSINAIVGVTTILMYDFWFVYCTQHLYVQLELTKEKFKTLANFKGLDDIYVVHSPKFQKIIRKRLQYCIQHHGILISFGYDLRKMTSIVNTFQSATTLVSLIFLGYSFTKEHNNMIDVYEIITFTTSIIVQILIYTLNGAELQFQSEAVAKAIYDSKWYLFQGPLRKDLVFAIMNSQKMVRLTAGGLFNLNNQTLIQILRLAFSSVTLLPSEDSQTPN